MYFRQVADAYAIGNYRHEPRLADPERPAELAFTADDFASARAEAGRHAAGAARRRDRARLQRADVVHARRLPAAGRERRGARAVAGPGDLGHALGRLRARAGRAHDPRRRAARPPRVRPASASTRTGRARATCALRGAQGYREVYDVLHPRQQNEQARGLRTTPFYEREERLGAEFFESAGWERPQWYEANRELLTGDEVLPHDEWAARYWSPIVQAEHRACRERVGIFDLTPFTKVEVKGPGRAGLPAAPGGQRRRQAGGRRSSTRRCSRRAAGSCAT